MFLPIGDDVQSDTPPFAGLSLILVCVVVWIQSCKVDGADPLPYHTNLYTWYTTWGLSGRDFAEGRFLGLFTHMFVHAGFMHLLGNMLAFWAFVWTLEAVMGAGRFLFLYVACGLAAGGVHAVMSGDSVIPLVGASGAIAGVIGAYCLKFGPTTRIKCLFFFVGRPFTVEFPAVVFAGIWLLTQLYGQLMSTTGEGGVAWLAHLVGFSAGSLLMPLLYDEERGHIRADKDGTLVVEKNGTRTAADPRLRPFQFDHDRTTTTCAGCEQVLDATSLISPGLWLCSDQACKRLNYAVADSVPTAAPESSPLESTVPV